VTNRPEPTVTPITDPAMEGTHFGIAVASLGEDGDLIALGHHDDDKALAAFRAFTGHSLDLGEAVSRGWAYFHVPQPDNGDWEWIAEPSTADTPGAVPVTYLI